jgi:hypothetical protein
MASQDVFMERATYRFEDSRNDMLTRTRCLPVLFAETTRHSCDQFLSITCTENDACEEVHIL